MSAHLLAATAPSLTDPVAPIRRLGHALLEELFGEGGRAGTAGAGRTGGKRASVAAEQQIEPRQFVVLPVPRPLTLHRPVHTAIVPGGLAADLRVHAPDS
jgi:hypothetical protein